MKRFSFSADGQSLLEAILAMAFFGLIAAALVTMVLGGFRGLEQGGEQTQAEALAQEGIEAVRAIRDRAWNELRFDESAVSTSTGMWEFDGEGTSQIIGQYTRTILFEDVCRDGNDDIVDCPAGDVDIHTKKVISRVSWTTAVGATNTVERISYMTNWDSPTWTQTDWYGNSGQSLWSDTTRYETDDQHVVTTGTPGQVALSYDYETLTAFYTSGYVMSSAYAMASSSAVAEVISWDEDLSSCSPTCAVEIQIQTAPDNAGAPGTFTATWSGPDGDDGDETDAYKVSTGELIHLDHMGDAWIRYRALLTGTGTATPVFQAVRIYYK